MMKSKLITIITTALLSSTIYGANFASCAQDTSEMWLQIDRWGSITSQDRRQFDAIGTAQTKGNNQCSANGYQYGRFICVLTWDMGNWGSTLHC